MYSTITPRSAGLPTRPATTLVQPFNSRLSVLNTTTYPEDLAKG
ncbi:hypothetical protein [Pseudomonas putida]|nr:hypothetical protein [Pseudomonas putida]